MKKFSTLAAAVLLAGAFGGVFDSIKRNAVNIAFASAVVGAAAMGILTPGEAMGVGFALMAGNAPYPIQPELTAIALAYTNRSAIADEVLPRLPVGTKEFKYLVNTQSEGFTIPDTRVGRRSSPGVVEFSATEVAGFCKDYGLDDVIPQDDIDNAPPNYDPMGRSTAMLTNLIVLDREVRVANLVFANATYPAANRVTLAGVSQWSDYTNSDPVAAIMNALDGVVIRPNIAVFGRATFTKLRMHPKVVQAVLGVANTGAGLSAGAVSRKAIADLLELDDVLVGESFYNTAKKGQTQTLARAWGKHAAFLYRDKTAMSGGKTVTFGYTAQFRGRTAGSWQVKEGAGIAGGTKVRVGESVAEVVCANDTGYFFENAVA